MSDDLAQQKQTKQSYMTEWWWLRFPEHLLCSRPPVSTSLCHCMFTEYISAIHVLGTVILSALWKDSWGPGRLSNLPQFIYLWRDRCRVWTQSVSLQSSESFTATQTTSPPHMSIQDDPFRGRLRNSAATQMLQGCKLWHIEQIQSWTNSDNNRCFGVEFGQAGSQQMGLKWW